MHLSPWPLVAAVFNLEVMEGMRPGPMIDARTAKLMCNRALRRFRRELERRGVDRAVVDALFAMKADGQARRHENLVALLPPPARVRDEGDPSATRSLRAAR